MRVVFERGFGSDRLVRLAVEFRVCLHKIIERCALLRRVQVNVAARENFHAVCVYAAKIKMALVFVICAVVWIDRHPARAGNVNLHPGMFVYQCAGVRVCR